MGKICVFSSNKGHGNPVAIIFWPAISHINEVAALYFVFKYISLTEKSAWMIRSEALFGLNFRLF